MLALKQGHFIVEDELDEVSLVDFLYGEENHKNSRLLIRTMPTMSCNFCCPYCTQYGKALESRVDYFDCIEKYISSTISNFKFLHISLFGGEPLLVKQETFDFLEYLHELCSVNRTLLSCSITTNGSLLDESTITQLIYYGLNSMQITLDGSIENHNRTRCYCDGSPSFSDVKSNIELVSKMVRNIDGFTLIVRVNLANIDIQDAENMLASIDQSCRKNIFLTFRSIYNTDNYTHNNSNNNGDLDRFMKMGYRLGFKILQNTSRLIPCEASGNLNSFYVAPDLSVWKCVTNLSFQKAKMGYISTDGELILDYSNVLDWFEASNPFKNNKCRQCDYLPRCLGGCILHSMMSGEPKCRYFDMGTTPIFYKD